MAQAQGATGGGLGTTAGTTAPVTGVEPVGPVATGAAPGAPHGRDVRP